MKGVSDTLFAPQGTVTRAQLVTILYRFSGEPGLNGLTPVHFDDVPEGTWYSEAVAWASGMGIVNGVGEVKFDPSGAVTREQIVLTCRFGGM